MSSERKQNSTIHVPDSLQGEVSAFIFYPGIPVTCSVNNKLDLPSQKNIGEVYMPPSVRNGVPDWFDKYVIVFPHTHTASFNLVKGELDTVLNGKNLKLAALNVGVFSGSGNIPIPSSVKLTTFLVMDTIVGPNTTSTTKRVLADGGKVFLMFGPSSWGGQATGHGTNYWKPIFEQLKPEDYGEIKSSTYASFGFPADEDSGCGQRMWHMVMPQYFLSYFKSKIEAVQPKPEDPPAPPPGPTQSDASNTGSQNSEPVNAKKANLSGKIILKKKSGPGEITGVTELDLDFSAGPNNPFVEFKEIQFTEPGDYILTLSGTSEDIGFREISVKVLEEGQEEQDPKNEENPRPANGNRPIIAQIDAPTIKLQKIEVPVDNLSKGKDQLKQGIVPVISYNGNIIKAEDIVSFSIFHDGILPNFTLDFKDTNNLMKDTGAPQDQTNIDVFINSNSPNIKSVHLQFKIDNFDKGRRNLNMSLSGTLNVGDLYVQNNKSYKGTSFEVLRTICKELGLGFNSNIENTSDSMSWRNTNKRPYEFMEEIIRHSYISDESFMIGYIDYYYCFNYVDVNKEYKRDNRDDVIVDTTPWSGGTDEAKIVPLQLNNDKSYSSSTLYINKYSFKNNSTEVSLKEGYRTRTKFYDRIKKAFMVFNVDSQTSDGKDQIILKGTEGDTNFYDKNTTTRFLGKLDSDNTHINHNYAVVQNQINLRNLQKTQMDLVMPNPNFCIYKYMKCYIQISNESRTPTQEDPINWRYSGNYIITDIAYEYKNGTITQELTLYRSELGKTPDEIQNPEATQKPKETKENNPNPDVPGSTQSQATQTFPNSLYVPGDEYIVEDGNGKKYRLTVKEILTNGTEIIGTLQEII